MIALEPVVLEDHGVRLEPLTETPSAALRAAVADGRFRDDLFYRLDVVHVHLPPLRSRGGDVLLLAQGFVARSAARMGKNVTGMSAAVAQALNAYAWPGNVRELFNCIERAVALARFEQLAVDDLPDRVRNYRSAHVVVAGDDPSELVPLEEVERRYILRVLDAAGGRRGHVFNLGHGILPETPVDNVRAVVDYVHERGAGAR